MIPAKDIHTIAWQRAYDINDDDDDDDSGDDSRVKVQ